MYRLSVLLWCEVMTLLFCFIKKTTTETRGAGREIEIDR